MGARGDGSVEKLKSGRFRARVDLGFRADGTRNRPSKTFKTRSAAEQRGQLENQTAQKRPPENDRNALNVVCTN